jgi:aminomethyltransferase
LDFAGSVLNLRLVSEIQSTPLEALHLELGARMVPFAGWNMPVMYSSILDEHSAVRTTCGIFDISHMGQFIVRGPRAESWLNQMLASNVSKLEIGQGQYSFLLNPQGGVIDDLIIYRSGETSYFLVVNASKIDEDFGWMHSHLEEGIELENESALWAGLAVQGPQAAEVFAKACPGLTLPSRNGISGTDLVVCRTGYTGEDGFEFFCPAAEGSDWFRKFIEAGAKPCGLGARDSLRLEMCYPLNGSDLSPEHTPLEAGLGFFVDLEKGDFIGRDVLLQQKNGGLSRRLVALEYTDKGAPPRAHYGLFTEDGTSLGELTSGVLSPSTGKGIAMAYVPLASAKLGTILHVDVRGRRFPAAVVKKPFYKKA